MFLQVLRRSAGPALLIGGALMIVAQLIVWIIGFQTGKLAPHLGANASYILTHIGYLASEVPVLPLGVGMLGVYALARDRENVLSLIGAIFIILSMVAAILALAIPGNGENSAIGAIGGVAQTLGVVALAIVALRVHLTSTPATLTLLCATVLFIPLLFATPLPFGPDWATDFLAFFIGGVGYVVMGVSLEQRRRSDVASVHVQPAVQANHQR